MSLSPPFKATEYSLQTMGMQITKLTKKTETISISICHMPLFVVVLIQLEKNID